MKMRSKENVFIIKKMKKFIIFLLILFSISLFSCKKEIKTIKIGINIDYPPFSFKENEKLVGFNIDFLNLLLKELNLKGEFLEIKDINFEILLNNEVQFIIGGYPLKYKYPQGVSITMPYFDLSYYLISRVDMPIDSINSLEDKKLILPMYTFAEEIVKNVKNLIKIPYKNFNEAVISLENKDADAILIERTFFDIYKLDENKFFKAKVYDNGLVIVLKDDNNDLRNKINNAISKIINSKDYKKLILNWFEEER
ncbi:MAG: transporter substrate-binding domain-containing protein [Caldisericia bacterium]|nr:transporter substrate-binding domain-containing protein [Caldisericia bacterium]